uniref:Uncharacterized protein n=1 Tax=Chrysemys picta bellii TaxID=8478 RepID=A0A8C3I9M2_CHRPI
MEKNRGQVERLILRARFGPLHLIKFYNYTNKRGLVISSQNGKPDREKKIS